VPLFREAGAPPGESGGWGIGWPSGTERQRIILVETGPDNVLLVALDDTSTPSSFDELVAAAMPIVESLEFPRVAGSSPDPAGRASQVRRRGRPLLELSRDVPPRADPGGPRFPP
jgi:hypothetical protein